MQNIKKGNKKNETLPISKNQQKSNANTPQTAPPLQNTPLAGQNFELQPIQNTPQTAPPLAKTQIYSFSASALAFFAHLLTLPNYLGLKISLKSGLKSTQYIFAGFISNFENLAAFRANFENLCTSLKLTPQQIQSFSILINTNGNAFYKQLKANPNINFYFILPIQGTISYQINATQTSHATQIYYLHNHN